VSLIYAAKILHNAGNRAESVFSENMEFKIGDDVVSEVRSSFARQDMQNEILSSIEAMVKVAATTYTTPKGLRGMASIYRSEGDKCMQIINSEIRPSSKFVQFVTKDKKNIVDLGPRLVHMMTPKPKNPALGDRFEDVGEEHYMFKSLHGNCLDAFIYWHGIPFNSAMTYNLHLHECSVTNQNQQWVVDPYDHRIRHAYHPNICLDVDEEKVQVWECHSHDLNPNQWIDLEQYM
jgi:hypothetical protein